MEKVKHFSFAAVSSFSVTVKGRDSRFIMEQDTHRSMDIAGEFGTNAYVNPINAILSQSDRWSCLNNSHINERWRSAFLAHAHR